MEEYRILRLIQQDREAGVHDSQEDELDPKVLDVFQWLEERENKVKAKEAKDYGLDEAISAVGDHKINETG
jgi:hypothetical protein